VLHASCYEVLLRELRNNINVQFILASQPRTVARLQMQHTALCGDVPGRNVLFWPSCGIVPAPSWMLSGKTTHTQVLRHILTCNNTMCPAPVPPPALPARPTASHFERCEFTLPAVSPWPQCSDRKYQKPYVHQFTIGLLGYRQAHAEHFCTLLSCAHAPGQRVGCAPPSHLVRSYNRG
jgi:hypothetical protein